MAQLKINKGYTAYDVDNFEGKTHLFTFDGDLDKLIKSLRELFPNPCEFSLNLGISRRDDIDTYYMISDWDEQMECWADETEVWEEHIDCHDPQVTLVVITEIGNEYYSKPESTY